jgi:SAM-dependent methyltransferase
MTNLPQALLDALARHVRDVDGWCTLEKAVWMAQRILDERPNLIVEVGVWRGRSFACLVAAACAADNGVVLGIDPYSYEIATQGTHHRDEHAWLNDVDFEQVHRDFWRYMLTARNAGRRWHQIRGTFADVVLILGSQTVDFLHVDGNHSPEVSLSDVEHALRIVREDGIIVLDDIDWPSVRAARELLDSKLNPEIVRETWAAWRA